MRCSVETHTESHPLDHGFVPPCIAYGTEYSASVESSELLADDR